MHLAKVGNRELGLDLAQRRIRLGADHVHNQLTARDESGVHNAEKLWPRNALDWRKDAREVVRRCGGCVCCSVSEVSRRLAGKRTMVGKTVDHMGFKLCALLLVLLDGSLVQLLLRGGKSAH